MLTLRSATVVGGRVFLRVTSAAAAFTADVTACAARSCMLGVGVGAGAGAGVGTGTGTVTSGGGVGPGAMPRPPAWSRRSVSTTSSRPESDRARGAAAAGSGGGGAARASISVPMAASSSSRCSGVLVFSASASSAPHPAPIDAARRGGANGGVRWRRLPMKTSRKPAPNAGAIASLQRKFAMVHVHNAACERSPGGVRCAAVHSIVKIHFHQ